MSSRPKIFVAVALLVILVLAVVISWPLVKEVIGKNSCYFTARDYGAETFYYKHGSCFAIMQDGSLVPMREDE